MQSENRPRSLLGWRLAQGRGLVHALGKGNTGVCRSWPQAVNTTHTAPLRKGASTGARSALIKGGPGLGPISPPWEGTPPWPVEGRTTQEQGLPRERAPPCDQRQGLKTTGLLPVLETNAPDLKPTSAFLDGANYLPINSNRQTGAAGGSTHGGHDGHAGGGWSRLSLLRGQCWWRTETEQGTPSNQTT